MSSSDYQQQAQLLQQLQHHSVITTHVYLLYLAFSLPLPIAWKITVYHFLAQLPIPPLSPGTITLLVILGPLVTIVLLYLFIKILCYFIQSLLPTFLEKYISRPQQNTFLELTFPHDTSKSSYATEEVFTLIHTLPRMRTWIIPSRKTYSFELVSTREQGIRYIIGIPGSEAEVITRTLLSYLPGLTITAVADYITPILHARDNPTKPATVKTRRARVVDFQLVHDFALPLHDQKQLGVHDSIAFLTGNMTKPKEEEVLALQLILRPSLSHATIKHISLLKKAISLGNPVAPMVLPSGMLIGILPPLLLFLLSPLIWCIVACGRLLLTLPYLILDPRGPQSQSYFSHKPQMGTVGVRNPYEEEMGRYPIN